MKLISLLNDNTDDDNGLREYKSKGRRKEPDNTTRTKRKEEVEEEEEGDEDGWISSSAYRGTG